MPISLRTTLFRTLLLAAMSSTAVAHAAPSALEAAISAPTRTPALAARDGARHPATELQFFGLKPDDTVVEIWPGGGYWTEILAPYLRPQGHLYAVLPGAPGATTGMAKGNAGFRAKLAAAPALYDKVTLTSLDANPTLPAGTADRVLTFRNLHNWMGQGEAPAVLATFLRMLKPGGVLGIEDHRGHRDDPQDPKAKDGYVRQDYAIALIEKAGFVFDGSSEIDANPKDTAHWPQGVWTLPPVLALGQQDRARYQAIGEADNFVLRFHKPGP